MTEIQSFGENVVMLVVTPFRNAEDCFRAEVVCGGQQRFEGVVPGFELMGAQHPDVPAFGIGRGRLDGGYFEGVKRRAWGWSLGK